MSVLLTARKHAKDTLRAAGLTPVFRGEKPPGTAYLIVDDVDDPPLEDWGGEFGAWIYIQVSAYALSSNPTDAALPGDKARKALLGAGWQRVPTGGKPLSIEQHPDGTWQRHLARYRRMF